MAHSDRILVQSSLYWPLNIHGLTEVYRMLFSPRHFLEVGLTTRTFYQRENRSCYH